MATVILFQHIGIVKRLDSRRKRLGRSRRLFKNVVEATKHFQKHVIPSVLIR